MPAFGPPEYDAGTIEDDQLGRMALTIGNALIEGESMHIRYEPGNYTRYELIFTPLNDTWVVVSWIATGCYWFDLIRRPRQEILHPTYVAEKLKGSLGDGAAIANLLTEIGEITRQTEVT